MTDRNNFLGLSGFIWWLGVIVNREDKLTLGRCQVRIFGWHTENRSALPDEDLPWAMPIYPVNAKDTFSSPKVGEWVFGFFMDGESGQFPVYMGVFPTLVPLVNTASNGFNPSPESGAPVSAYGTPTPGQSSLPLQAQGVYTNTGVATSDNDRIHVCDVCAKTDFSIAKQKLSQLVDVSGLTAQAKALFAAESSSPLAENVQDIITTVKAQTKLVKQYTDTISEEVKAAQQYTQYIQDTIKQIESLPAELQSMYAGCLSDLKSSLKSVKV